MNTIQTGCISKMHVFDETESLLRIMQRKHFCVEQFLKEGEKDLIIETMQNHNKMTQNFKPDYFANSTEFEKQYFQPSRPGEVVSLNY